MHLQIGDYVEGYRMEKYCLEVKYTRGWVVDIDYRGDHLKFIMINEDITSMLNKYWPDKDKSEVNEEQEHEMKYIKHLDSMYLVVGDTKYPVRKVKREADWWSRYYWKRDTITMKRYQTELMPYYLDKSMYKIVGVAKAFTLDGVLQVPNSSYTDGLYGKEHENKPIRKMLDYIDKYTVRNRRILITKVGYSQDIEKALKGKVSREILDLFDTEKILRAPTFGAKACLVHDIACNNEDDILVIDSDARFVKLIHDEKLFDNQCERLKAVHVSALIDMKL